MTKLRARRTVSRGHRRTRAAPVLWRKRHKHPNASSPRSAMIGRAAWAALLSLTIVGWGVVDSELARAIAFNSAATIAGLMPCNRRVSKGDQVSRVAALAMKCGKSVDFTGYWQRHIQS
jgi:hypothetical protein